MKFQLNKDVTEGAIVFSDEELKIIKKNGTIFRVIVFKLNGQYAFTFIVL